MAPGGLPFPVRLRLPTVAAGGDGGGADAGGAREETEEQQEGRGGGGEEEEVVGQDPMEGDERVRVFFFCRVFAVLVEGGRCSWGVFSLCVVWCHMSVVFCVALCVACVFALRCVLCVFSLVHMFSYV